MAVWSNYRGMPRSIRRDGSLASSLFGIGLLIVALGAVPSAFGQWNEMVDQPGREGSPWFGFQSVPLLPERPAALVAERTEGTPFEGSQLPTDAEPGNVPGMGGQQAGRGSEWMAWGTDENSTEVSLYNHVPPNRAEVLPELDFRQFPMVPREPIPQPLQIRPYKEGFFQRLAFTGTYLDRGASRSTGVTELELSLSVALPWPSVQQPLIVTPGFNTTFLESPTNIPLPNTVYDAYLQTMWLPKFSDHWGGIFAVTTGVYSDFDKVTSEAIRVTGRALVRWDMIPDELQWVAGVIVLNRADVRVLPGLGLIWSPEEHVRHEVIFPRPKFAWRLGYEPGQWDDWVYFAGEFGGDTWQVQRGNETDRLTMRDWRIMMGFERKRDGGGGMRVEVGYVFWRQFEFERTSWEYRPDSTVMLRMGGAF
jgi:hypothetical protein